MENFEKWPLLASIHTPLDVKALSEKQLKQLAHEIRDYLVFRVSENGGHLASNLGVVEMTLAIHRVFDLPADHLIFDVGHQSYVHKLLTGRKEHFDTLRQAGGISGFTKRAESEYDAFGAGHSSTAISAALGMAEADALAGRKCWTVAVVGDGALTGGLALEALNNCRRNLRLLIIINENEMSISPNTGRLAQHLSHIRASRPYINTKKVTSFVLRHVPLIGPFFYRIISRLKRRIKRIFYHENLFEHMGIRYVGPVDGNDQESMISMLEYVKKSEGSVILHAKTVKGHGYAPAEEKPSEFHAMPPRDKKSGEESFSQAMGAALCALAEQDPRICAITAAMPVSTGLAPFSAAHPKRFFDVGIAEEHAVTFAAGLAAAGMRPVVALYSTFSQRAYDQILHDAALQHLPVVLCVDRAGLNAGDGATHHGVLDVAMLSAIPDAHIYAPVTAEGVQRALHAALAAGEISVIRYPAGAPLAAIGDAFYREEVPPAPGLRIWQSGEAPAISILTHGRITASALEAAQRLAKDGIHTRILLCEQIAPYGEVAARVSPYLAPAVLFLEEEIRTGGFGMNLCDRLQKMGQLVGKRYEILATEDPFVAPAAGQTPLDAAGLSPLYIENTLRRLAAIQ
ncbi:MAG: 1-deoxy-D-xylulose-5-phosphate synthase [Ruminococcaceae bacterium]|nr:1-deoxy-D-xylulose-5-phosphate synthase [Oscillospiraceae bacterium]